MIQAASRGHLVRSRLRCSASVLELIRRMNSTHPMASQPRLSMGDFCPAAAAPRKISTLQHHQPSFMTPSYRLCSPTRMAPSPTRREVRF